MWGWRDTVNAVVVVVGVILLGIACLYGLGAILRLAP